MVRAVSALTRLAEAPEQAAIVLDIDGTLAPIVRRPNEAAVPEGARHELGRLVARYALVACVSGRTGEDARPLVAVEGVRYVGRTGSSSPPRQPAGETRSTASRRAWTGPSRTRA